MWHLDTNNGRKQNRIGSLGVAESQTPPPEIRPFRLLVRTLHQSKLPSYWALSFQGNLKKGGERVIKLRKEAI